LDAFSNFGKLPKAGRRRAKAVKGIQLKKQNKKAARILDTRLSFEETKHKKANGTPSGIFFRTKNMHGDAFKT
jgi:hypothetical protein